MSEVIKRYTFFAYLDDDVAELDCHEEEDGNYVLASDYDRDTKALEDKARSQHARDSAELRDLCSQRDGFKAELWRVKEERDSQQRIAIAAMAELAELKAKSSGVDERAAFEARFPLHDMSKRQDDDGDIVYLDDWTQGAFIGWQARAALSAPSKDGV